MIFASSLIVLLACNPESKQEEHTPNPSATNSEGDANEEAIPQPDRHSVREVPRPRLHARHILVAYSTANGANPTLDRTKEEAKIRAEQLLKQIDQGADFGDLAKNHSDDASRKRGGDLGVFTKGIMHKNFEDATLALEVGQHSELVETPFGFHLIERLPVIEAHVAHVLIQWADLKRTTSDRSREDAVLVAEQALAELNAGRPFAEVAKKFSDGPFGSRGGNLGWFQKGQMVPQFDAAAFELEAGDTSSIVESANGFHIIHRIE